MVGGAGGHTGEPASEGSATAVAAPAGFIEESGMDNRFSNRYIRPEYRFGLTLKDCKA